MRTGTIAFRPWLILTLLALVFPLAAGTQPEEFFLGLPHATLGQARIAQNPDGSVAVNLLDASSESGVTISPGSSEGLHLVANLPPRAAFPIGAKMRNRIYKDDRLLGELLIEHTEAGFVHTPDFSMSGSPTYTLSLLRQGVVVFRQSGMSGPAATAANLSLRLHVCLHSGPTGLPTISFSRGPSAWLVADKVVMADTLVADAEATTDPRPGVLRMDLLAWDIPRFQIPAEFLMQFGAAQRMAQAHQALGRARFDATPGRLTLTDLGPGGLDGVRLDFTELATIFGLPSVHGIDVKLAALSLRRSDRFDLTATGVSRGVPGTHLGRASVLNRRGQLELSADFSPLGTSRVRVEVYRAGRRVGSADLRGGTVGTLTSGARIVGCGQQARVELLPGLVLKTERPVDFTPVGGGASLTGDEFRLLALRPSGLVDQLSAFDITLQTGSGGTFSILGETPLTFSGS